MVSSKSLSTIDFSNPNISSTPFFTSHIEIKPIGEEALPPRGDIPQHLGSGGRVPSLFLLESWRKAGFFPALFLSLAPAGRNVGFIPSLLFSLLKAGRHFAALGLSERRWVR